MGDAVTFPADVRADEVCRCLRDAGAVFAFGFGSRVGSGATPPRPASDLDVGAWWPSSPPSSWQVELPGGIDLTVLNDAPLRLAGRVAMYGVVLFDDDPPARVRWQAQVRKRYVDERPRWQRADAVFRQSVRDG